MTLFEELKWRGLIKDYAGDDLENKLNNEKITFYWGTDPTADSLHIGHYSSLITAKRLAMHGHHPILLVGGGTALIGDPRPTSERQIIPYETVQKNINGIKEQIDKILDGKAELVNNYDWLKDMDLITFLRDVGKYININYMLDKDIIRRRLDTGITFAEFTYTLMQGYDFMNLCQTKNCILQVAGSDQWGNITTGVDLINKTLNKKAYAFTMPLILDINGNKFGKSEGNALWLDIDKTSSYELYQYLINTDDSMIEDYLKVYTFLTPEEIMEVVSKHNEAPHLRYGQKVFAKEFITDLHGKEEYEKAVNISEKLFVGDIKNINSKDLLIGLKGVPNIEIEPSKLIDLLVDGNICSSKREAREFLNSNAISINGDIVNDENMIIDKTKAIDGKFIIIRRGKKKYFIANFK